MNSMLTGKVIVVTGGLGLIGQSLCKSILDEGGVPISLDIKDSVSSDYECLVCDCTNETSVKQQIDCIVSRHGRIDGLVHSAYPKSERWGQSFENISYESVCIDLSLQLGASILISKIFHELFLHQGSGSFVHISSIQGIASPKFNHYIGTNMTSPIEYAAIKAGIISITKWLAKYSFNTGVRYNCISPGGIIDNQPLEFIERYRSSCANIGLLNSSDLSYLTCYLLSDRAKCVTGQNFIVDDGWSL